MARLSTSPILGPDPYPDPKEEDPATWSYKDKIGARSVFSDLHLSNVRP